MSLPRRSIVVDIGTSSLKIFTYERGTYTYSSFGLVNRDGLIDPRRIIDIVDSIADEGRDLILTGQRASIIGWNSDTDYSMIYTWRYQHESSVFNIPDEYRDIVNTFLRPGSGAERIKLLQDMGYKYVGGVESFVTWLLTGKYVVDKSYAYAYGLIDPVDLSYSDLLIEVLDIDVERLPVVVDSFSEELRGSCSVLTMVPDQSAALFTTGLDEQCLKITLGTGGFIDKYLGGNIVGDLEHGVIPLLSFLDGDGARYMAEYIVFQFGDLIDSIVRSEGIDYKWLGRNVEDVIERINGDVEIHLLRTSEHPEITPPSDLGLYEAISSLVGSIGLGVSRVNGLVESEFIEVNGGAARNHLFPRLIAEVTGLDVRIRSRPELSTLVGAGAYTIYRLGGNYMSFIDRFMPLEKVYEGSGRLSWVVDKYLDLLEKKGFS